MLQFEKKSSLYICLHKQHQQKKKRRLCDLSGKRHRVFSSVASVASVVPLCRLCGKKALCTFLNEKKAKFHCGMYTVHFFHRGDTEAPQIHRGHRGENTMP